MKRSYRILVDICKNSTIWWGTAPWLVNPWHLKSRDPGIQESRLGCPLKTFCCVLHFSNQILNKVQTIQFIHQQIRGHINANLYFTKLHLRIWARRKIKKLMLQHCLYTIVLYPGYAVVLQTKTLFNLKIISWLSSSTLKLKTLWINMRK